MSHLGGHINKTNLDSGLLKFLINEFQIKSMLDIGCGTGGMVDLGLEKHKLDAWGIEGDSTIKDQCTNPEKIVFHDFTGGPAPLTQEFDLGYSCEFLEHVEEKYMDNYMKAFQKCKIIVFTAAPPKWPGVHHVNCQNHDYWIQKFGLNGFLYDPRLTKLCREKSTMNFKRNIRKQFVRQRCLFMFNIKYLNEIKYQINAGANLQDGFYDINSKYLYTLAPFKVTRPEHPGYIFETQLPYSSIIGQLEHLGKYPLIKEIRSVKIYCSTQSDCDLVTTILENNGLEKCEVMMIAKK